MLRYVDLEEDTEAEGEGDGHEEPGDAEEDPAAQTDAGHHVRVVWGRELQSSTASTYTTVNSQSLKRIILKFNYSSIALLTRGE